MKRFLSRREKCNAIEVISRFGFCCVFWKFKIKPFYAPPRHTIQFVTSKIFKSHFVYSNSLNLFPFARNVFRRPVLVSNILTLLGPIRRYLVSNNIGTRTFLGNELSLFSTRSLDTKGVGNFFHMLLNEVKILRPHYFKQVDYVNITRHCWTR